jgi:hypothetical protein
VKDELNQTSTFDPGIPPKNPRRLGLPQQEYLNPLTSTAIFLDFPNEEKVMFGLILVIKAAPNIASSLFSSTAISPLFTLLAKLHQWCICFLYEWPPGFHSFAQRNDMFLNRVI